MIDLIQVRFIMGVIGSVLTIVLTGVTVPPLVKIENNKPVPGDKPYYLLDLVMHYMLPAVVKLVNNKAVPRDKPYYLLDSVMHYMLWVLYGLPLLNENSSLFLLITGGFGLGVEAFLLTFFFINCGDEKNLRRYIVSRLLVDITCVVVIVLITVFAIKSSSAKQTFVGVICNISFINGMPKSHIISLIKALEPESTDEYIRPFYVQKVLEMESTDKYLPPFWLTFIGFLNYIAWTAFSLIDKIDFCLLIINFYGTLVSGSQLYAYYKSTAKVKTD